MNVAAQPRVIQALHAKTSHWPRWVLFGILGLAVLLLGLRIAAPSILKNLINRRLAEVEGYAGHVDNIDLQLWRGAYRLDDVTITRRVGKEQAPFFSAQRIDFSLAWRELFRGRILSEIEGDRVELSYAPTPDDVSATEVKARPWQEVVADLFPIDISYVELRDSRLSYRDEKASPPVDISLTKLQGRATGLRNRASSDDSKDLPATITATGTSVGGGVVKLDVAAEPLAPQPTFELKFEIEGVDLRALNDYLMAYGKVDVSAGTFKMYAEMAARDGKFEGYVKPFFENVSFKDVNDKDKKVMMRVWEKIVSGLVVIFRNREDKQVATRIPFSGEIDSPDVGIWATLGNLFNHGFVRALTDRLEGTPRPDGNKALPPEKKKGAE